ncbi:MAG: hypothetical protein CVT99_15870 [Bacteroidetes bacterium HGW-Bacteroidetes-16]|jgi:hypothetical protein|nr:MAG: hypothetical protein CVT99_15870 [Bacteroidetes bacterium HGW-Bacteroidetes-16]
MNNLSLALLFLTLLFTSNSLPAQLLNEFYWPLEVKTAYENHTRSPDGNPGKNYFQNQADYSIQAEFFPDTKMLNGVETITYKNNSPDTLSNLYFNLFQNLYKKGITRDADVDAINIHDGVKIKRVSVNGILADSNLYRFYNTIFVVHSPVKLTPSSNSTIEIEWTEKMPVTDVKRQGTYDSSSFFIAYWYPKICVFDDVEGWNAVGHKGTAEFYSDFGNFDVEITAPANYLLWSSGNLQNADEIFTKKFAERIKQAAQSDTVVQIVNEADRKENQITKPSEKHLWKLNSENQTDFAFALSDCYLWDGASVLAGSVRIPVNSVYQANAKNFKLVTRISQLTVDFYATQLPAIPFPYKQLTAFHGRRGGMEFPGMINDDDFSSDMETGFVTTHEIGHAYFPFNVGINEQKYGWMDEALVTFIGLEAFADQIGDTNFMIFGEVIKSYQEKAGSQTIDIPVMMASYELSDQPAGFTTYIKPATALYLLYNYLGKEKFYQAIRLFTDRWKGKHPIPYDLFFTFNEAADEDLAWFWKPWFFEFGYSDLAIGEIKKGKNANIITIENKGGYPVPLILTIKYMDGTKEVIKKKMDIWKTGIKSYDVGVPEGDIEEIILNNAMIPECSNDNNRIRL